MIPVLYFAVQDIYWEKHKSLLINSSSSIISLCSSLLSDDRRFTKNLLIDWERAEVLGKKEEELRLPRTVWNLPLT